MYAVERQQIILERLRANGRINARDLSRELGLSVESIRRDLITLEQQSLLKRVHGGAVDIARLVIPEPPMAERSKIKTAEKERIAAVALDHLPDSGVLFMEAASISVMIAERLPSDRDFLIATNGLLVAQALSALKNVEVLMVGGRLRPRSMSTVDDWALESLRSLHLDTAFLGSLAYSTTAGLTTGDAADAAVKRLILGVAEKNILLAEAAKYGAISVCRYGDIEDLDMLITDESLSESARKELREYDLEIVTA